MPGPSPLLIQRASFQSAPGREAGRCALRRADRRIHGGFNPRPAVRPGDAVYNPETKRYEQVSIRARP